MQLPSFDRTPTVRPASAELASTGANRVIPVAPVNPTASAPIASTPATPVEPVPSVVNLIGATSKKPNEGEPVYTSVADPVRQGAKADTTQKDWTIHRPAPEKVEDPPRKLISQVLMDHLKSVWTASASAIQLEQIKDQANPPLPQAPKEVPGELAKEVLTYKPSQIKKTENL